MRLALSFPPSAACRFLDLPPVNLRNLHLHLTKNPFAGQPPHLCGVTLRIAAPEIRRGDPGCQKSTESSRGPKPSRLLIESGGVYGGCGRIFAAENPIFQSKNRFLADFAPGDFEEILAKSGRGGDPGGIRTHGLSLRSAKKRSPLVPLCTLGAPYFTGFLTFLSVRISLQNTPVFPG